MSLSYRSLCLLRALARVTSVTTPLGASDGPGGDRGLGVAVNPLVVWLPTLLALPCLPPFLQDLLGDALELDGFVLPLSGLLGLATTLLTTLPHWILWVGPLALPIPVLGLRPLLFAHPAACPAGASCGGGWHPRWHGPCLSTRPTGHPTHRASLPPWPTREPSCR